MHRTGFKDPFEGSESRPSEAKARILGGLGGTAQAVPFPKPIFETSLRSFVSLRMPRLM
jgi:hypothetical protein